MKKDYLDRAAEGVLGFLEKNQKYVPYAAGVFLISTILGGKLVYDSWKNEEELIYNEKTGYYDRYSARTGEFLFGNPVFAPTRQESDSILKAIETETERIMKSIRESAKKYGIEMPEPEDSASVKE